MYTYVTTLFKLLLLAIVFFLLGTFLGLVCACDFKQLKQESACFALDDREACKQDESREQSIKSAMSSGGWNDRNLARQDLDESGRNWIKRNTEQDKCQADYLKCVSSSYIKYWPNGDWNNVKYTTDALQIQIACTECIEDCINMQHECGSPFWANYLYTTNNSGIFRLGDIVTCGEDRYE